MNRLIDTTKASADYVEAKSADQLHSVFDEDGNYIRPNLGERLEAKFEGVQLPKPGSPERAVLEKKLVRFLDCTILPIIWIMYILNYLDRNNIAAAKLSTIMEDLHMTDSQFSLAQIILFAGYIPFNIPSNYILEKTNYPGIYIALIMALWGLMTCIISTVNSHQTLAGLRFLTGVFEAGFYVGCIYILSSWYTKKEIASRAALYVSGSWVSGAVSGLIAWGVQVHLEGVDGKAAWRWLFLIEGVVTVGWAIITGIVLPSKPENSWQLSKELRLLAIVRLTEDVGKRDDDTDMDEAHNANKHFYEPLVLAAKDIKTWSFVGIAFMIASAASVSTVFPTIVKSLGYSTSKTYVFTMFPWLLVAVTSILNSYAADYMLKRGYNVRWAFSVWGPILSIIGYIMCISTTKTGPRYTGMFLILQIYNCWSLNYAWATTSLPRPPAKRAQALALINIAGNIPNLFMPFIFNAKSATPHFYIGFGLCIGFLVGAYICLALIVVLLKMANKRLDAGYRVDGMDPETGFRFGY